MQTNRIPDSWEDEAISDEESKYVPSPERHKVCNKDHATLSSDTWSPMNEAPGFKPKIRVMKREEASASSPKGQDKVTSQLPASSSVEEKKKRYEEARRRIFGQSDGL